MNHLRKQVAAMRRLTPKPGKGYNVVGVDTYEPLGEELYLVGNYATNSAAQKAKAAKEREIPSQKFYVYPPARDGQFDPAAR